MQDRVFGLGINHCTVLHDQTDADKLWAIKKVIHLEDLQNAKKVYVLLKNHAGQWLLDAFKRAKDDFRACA